MAREVVDLYHGRGAGAVAEERFDLVHRDREIPHDAPEVAVPERAVRNGRVWLPRLLVETGLASSNAEARRLMGQGGVRIGGEPVTDPETEVPVEELRGKIVQVSRRKFARLV
jgi:tyrosyl-tRNA synthetase